METIEYRQSSLRDFLHVIFKRKHQILLFFAVTVCTVVIGTFMMRPVYEAKAQILVKIGRENLYIPPNSTNSQVINYNQDDQVNSEIELLKSRSLAEKVIKTIGLEKIYKNMKYKDAVLKFQKSLSVEGIKKSDVIEVSFKHEDPEKAALIVNTLANAYLDEHLLVHRNPQSYNFFEDQSQVLKRKLEQSETALEAFKKQNTVTDLKEQQKLLLKQIADLHTDLNRTLSDEAETRNRALQIHMQLEKTPKSVPQGEEVDHNPYLISNLEARLVELKLKEKDLLLKYTPQSRLVKNVQEEMQIVQSKLAEQENKRYGKSTIGLNATYQRLQEDLLKNQAEIKAIGAKKVLQNAQLLDFQNRLEKLNQIDVTLDQLEQSVDVNRQNYRLYLAKFEESRISDAMDNKKMANVTLMQSALIPLKPVSPKVLLNIVLGIFLGGFGGLGLAFFTEYLDDSLGQPEHVEKVLQLPVLASIPKLDISDTRLSPSNSPPVDNGIASAKTKPLRARLSFAATVTIIGGLIFIGFYYLGSTGVLEVRSANSNSDIKELPSESVPTDHIKQSAPVTVADIPKPPAVASKDVPEPPAVASKDVPKPPAVPSKDVPKPPGVASKDVPNPPAVPSKNIPKPPLVASRDVSKLPVSDPRANTADLSKENVELKVSGQNRQRLDKAVSVTKDENMNRVVFQDGQSLYRIIIHAYGTYNDEILSKVLRANPDIISPTQIHKGQVINLPAASEYRQMNRAKGLQRLDKTVSFAKDENMNRVVFQDGQSLYRIIMHTYGTYNAEILSRVLHANPDIISPTHIHDGQIIALPSFKE
jgi:uncharacterized protein involved in exopolysaccharide biosynthesis